MLFFNALLLTHKHLLYWSWKCCMDHAFQLSNKFDITKLFYSWSNSNCMDYNSIAVSPSLSPSLFFACLIIISLSYPIIPPSLPFFISSFPLLVCPFHCLVAIPLWLLSPSFLLTLYTPICFTFPPLPFTAGWDSGKYPNTLIHSLPGAAGVSHAGELRPTGTGHPLCTGWKRQTVR